jgi:hypothetical protein
MQLAAPPSAQRALLENIPPLTEPARVPRALLGVILLGLDLLFVQCVLVDGIPREAPQRVLSALLETMQQAARTRVLNALPGNTPPLTGKARARCAPLGVMLMGLDLHFVYRVLVDSIPREAPLIVQSALREPTRQEAPARVQGVLQGVMPPALGTQAVLPAPALGTQAAPPAPLARTRPRPAGPVSSVLPGRGALSTLAPANKQPAPTRVVLAHGQLTARRSAPSAPLAITRREAA